LGKPKGLKTYTAPTRGVQPRQLSLTPRNRPRDYREWRALVRWGQLPPWEAVPAGYLLRAAREAARLTQAGLAERLDCSQQAVAQAERWSSNPTVEFLDRWATACGARLKISL
jgi:DNA-binding XRE family transcriptional regulator